MGLNYTIEKEAVRNGERIDFGDGIVYVPERTCKIESCEEFDERGIWAIELSCGHVDVYCVMHPLHCSYCGAKVVADE